MVGPVMATADVRFKLVLPLRVPHALTSFSDGSYLYLNLYQAFGAGFNCYCRSYSRYSTVMNVNGMNSAWQWGYSSFYISIVRLYIMHALNELHLLC